MAKTSKSNRDMSDDWRDYEARDKRDSKRNKPQRGSKAHIDWERDNAD